MSKKIPLEDISIRLGIPRDILERRLSHPDYLDTYNKLMQVGAAASYCKTHVLKNAVDLVEKMVKIAKDDKHEHQVTMLKHLSPHILITEVDRSTTRAQEASAEAQGRLAAVMEGLADRMLAMDAVRPKTIASPILEGEAALPSALARQRLERGERDGT